MKNKISIGTLAFAIVVLLMGVSPATAQSTVVRFDPSSATLSVGQTTTVNVYLADVSGLAGAMERLLADPARSAEMGKLAREHVCRKFSAELCADRVQEVYARLLR